MTWNMYTQLLKLFENFLNLGTLNLGSLIPAIKISAL